MVPTEADTCRKYVVPNLQAKLYADMLGLKFAYATNGPEILEFDYFTGRETTRSEFPSPAELDALLPAILDCAFNGKL